MKPKKIWKPAWEIAEEVYEERAAPRADGALFYHSKYIRPRWSRGKRRIAKIGRHIFYHGRKQRVQVAANQEAE